MMLALTGSLKFYPFIVSPKSSSFKGFPVKQNVLMALVAGLALACNASAALTPPTIATTDFETIAGSVLVALGVMWAIKKAIGLVRV